MIRVHYHKKHSFLLPQGFEECSQKQFIRLSQLLFTGGEELICQVKALRILCGLSAFRWALLSEHIIDRCLPYILWVYEEKKVITKQLLPRYKGYHGPASGFDNLKMKEFHHSERFYKEIAAAAEDDSVNEEEALNNLVAVLYRPGKKGYDVARDPDGDIRVTFNYNEIPYHAGKISRWPVAVKQAIFLWYDSCRQEMVDQNPWVFKEPSNHSFESEFDTGLYGMMRNLAGEKLGPVKEIEEMYVLTAMLEISLLKEEEKFFEQQMKAKP